MNRVIDVRYYKQSWDGQYKITPINENEIDNTDFDFIYDNDYCLSIEVLSGLMSGSGKIVYYLGKTWNDDDEVLYFSTKGSHLRKSVSELVKTFKKKHEVSIY